MRKELIGIFLFFGFVFALFSLLSYTPADPSVNNAAHVETVHNIFGLLGAHISGMFISLFGLGAFWIPVFFLLPCIRFLKNYPMPQNHHLIAGGSLLLMICTGSLFALGGDSYSVFGAKFSSGGLLGIALKSLIIKYSNIGGGTIILMVLLIVAFMFATDTSLANLSAICMRLMQRVSELAKDVSKDIGKIFLITWTMRRKKNRITPMLKDFVRKTRISERKPESKTQVSKPKMITYMPKDGGFQLPPADFLDEPDKRPTSVDPEHLKTKVRLLESKLEHFGIKGKVTAVMPGPVITTFEYEPSPGVKINKIVSLSDDLALALKALSIRIVAPIPGKSVIGVEIPNETREIVRLKELVSSDAFKKSKSRLTMCLGKDIEGLAVVAELDKMPHLLIAGATGTGKSVGLNAMICSLLYKSDPDEVKFIMVDPKRIELSMYDGIPHLIAPVVTDVQKATHALFWAVKEMERRYELLSQRKVRNISQYNIKVAKAKKEGESVENLPYLVIIIDELADLMMVSSKDVEVSLARLAQMARAAGVHLILATQRPSVDVLTGTIKANFPTRLSFKVSSKIDSRTIIDGNGAENLLGNGDMLFLPPGSSIIRRIQGAYISEEEVTLITEFLKSQRTPEYDSSVIESPEPEREPPPAKAHKMKNMAMW